MAAVNRELGEQRNDAYKEKRGQDRYIYQIYRYKRGISSSFCSTCFANPVEVRRESVSEFTAHPRFAIGLAMLDALSLVGKFSVIITVIIILSLFSTRMYVTGTQ